MKRKGKKGKVNPDEGESSLTRKLGFCIWEIKAQGQHYAHHM